MDDIRTLMHFYFITKPQRTNHYHQNPEIFYLLNGSMEVKIDDKTYLMRQGDLLLVNANKRHEMNGREGILAARFELDFHLLAEYMGSMQLLFWCNTITDKNDAYEDLRKVLSQILAHYFERNEKGALYLNALYFQAAHILTSNFLVNADDMKFGYGDKQNRIRILNIQNYLQANYQSQISLNDLANRLYLSNAYLSKYIKKNLGMTFVEYLNNIRLFHAVDELLYTNKNITHIALDNGFPTSAAFTKAFRECYNETPSEYRKKMQLKEKADLQNEELDEHNKKMIMDYLCFKEKGTIIQPKDEEICKADTKEKVRNLSKSFRACNVGDAYTLLQFDVQNQVRLLKKETGVEYIRIWNLFSNTYCFDEKEGLNFKKLDQVLDFLIENDLRPYLELGNKPTLVMYTPERSVKDSQKQKQENYDYDVFCKIIHTFCIHLLNRYGIEELEKWYFEFWNDPSLHIEEENGLYYKYFDLLYTTLKEFSENIKIGGAGFILGYETKLCHDVFKCWNERQIHPDFLAFCSYQYIAVIENEQRFGRKSIDGDYMENQVAIMKEMLEEMHFDVPEFHIDEWNFTVSNRNVLNDSCEQGAFILKNSMNVASHVNFMAYWHALDTYSYYYDTDAILNGDSGLITGDGIRKPSFFAFQFLNRLLPTILQKSEHGMLTTNGRNSYVAVCHNYKKLSSRYVFFEEDEIAIDSINQYVEDDESLKLTFHLDHVKNGQYQVKTYYVNRQNGSVQDLWKQLDYSKGLAKDEIEYLRNSSIPKIEMKTVEVKNGVLDIENVLEAQEIRMIEISYRYSS